MPIMSEYIEGNGIASMSINLAFSDKMSRELREPHNLQATTLWDDIGLQMGDTDPRSMDSDDDDDYDDGKFLFRPPSPARPQLDLNCLLARYRGEILQAATQRFFEFMLQCKKTQKFSEDNTMPRRHSTSTKPLPLPLPALPAPLPRPSSLPCPFYTHNPSQHLACLRHILHRPIDVKRHLWTSHRQTHPHGCPTCGSVFDMGAACDAHIRQRKCTRHVGNVPRMEREEGLSEAQVYQLVELADLAEEEDWEEQKEEEEEEEEREEDTTTTTNSQYHQFQDEWAAIWRIVFPEEVPPRGPENDTIMKELALLREFWDSHGREITAGLLAERRVYDTSVDSRKGKRDFRAL